MPKPQWLIDAETKKNKVQRPVDYCIDCIYIGRPFKMTKHKEREWVEVYECDIHPRCFNTKYSICCDDFTLA